MGWMYFSHYVTKWFAWLVCGLYPSSCHDTDVVLHWWVRNFLFSKWIASILKRCWELHGVDCHVTCSYPSSPSCVTILHSSPVQSMWFSYADITRERTQSFLLAGSSIFRETVHHPPDSFVRVVRHRWKISHTLTYLCSIFSSTRTTSIHHNVRMTRLCGWMFIYSSIVREVSHHVTSYRHDMRFTCPCRDKLHFLHRLSESDYVVSTYFRCLCPSVNNREQSESSPIILE